MAVTKALGLDRPHTETRSKTAQRYVARVAGSYAEVAGAWEQMAQSGAALPFQRRAWLEPWYASRNPAQVRALPVTLLDMASGAPVLALPLTLYSDGPLRIIACADAGLTDYNAPILASGIACDARTARAMLRAIQKALPPADVLYFGKMPERIGGLPNPLALLNTATPSRLNGNLLNVAGPWAEWHDGLERTFRKEMERSLRVFEKAGGIFRRITAKDEAERIFADLKIQQRERIAELGLPYILDAPENEAFYDRMLADGLAKGSTILTALTVNDETVAALFGCSDGRHFAMVRLSTGAAKWKICSPGRLLIERTMRHLHGEGLRMFDFTIGDYPYKRRMGVTTVPLRELRVALSWRGLPVVLKEKARDAVRHSPRIKAALKRVLG